MTDNIVIDPELLQAHAAKVEQVAADVRVAVQAATETMLSAGAFGLMCSWMIPPFLATAGTATGVLNSTASALDRSAREIRAVVADFDDYEQTVSATLRDLHSGLEAV
ncbi:hypothetical protein BH11ACT3_BH11ACT3_12400 [soil metagenome]